MTNAELIAWQNRVQSPIEKALRRAYQLGQTYWQQADSESYKQNRLSDETRQKFEDLVTETAAALLEPVGEGWQPIETAPKDGTLVVLGAPNGVWLGKYLPIYQSGFRPENLWSSMMLNHDHMAERYTRPTHWMPLPASPKSNGGMGS